MDTSDSSSQTPTPAVSESAAPAGGESAEVQAMIDNISAMGFEKDQVRAALRAAFNNPDRAVEYLMTVSYKSLSELRGFIYSCFQT